MGVDAVRDEPHHDPVVEKRRSHRAWGAVIEARHRVVQVGDHGGPRIDALHKLLVGGVGVAQAHHHLMRAQTANAREAILHLRRQGDQAQDVVLEERVVQVGGGARDGALPVRPEAARRDEGPLEVQPEGERARRAPAGQERLAGAGVDLRR